MTKYLRRDWVNCPICGGPDMRQEVEDDGNKLIFCVNHACRSNGGDYDASQPSAAAEPEPWPPEWKPGTEHCFYPHPTLRDFFCSEAVGHEGHHSNARYWPHPLVSQPAPAEPCAHRFEMGSGVYWTSSRYSRQCSVCGAQVLFALVPVQAEEHCELCGGGRCDNVEQPCAHPWSKVTVSILQVSRVFIQVLAKCECGASLKVAPKLI